MSVKLTTVELFLHKLICFHFLTKKLCLNKRELLLLIDYQIMKVLSNFNITQITDEFCHSNRDVSYEEQEKNQSETAFEIKKKNTHYK